jgi:hypothetical protein
MSTTLPQSAHRQPIRAKHKAAGAEVIGNVTNAALGSSAIRQLLPALFLLLGNLLRDLHKLLLFAALGFVHFSAPSSSFLLRFAFSIKNSDFISGGGRVAT